MGGSGSGRKPSREGPDPKPDNTLAMDRTALIEALKTLLEKPSMRKFGPLMIAPMHGTNNDCDPNLRDWGVRGHGVNRLVVLIHAKYFRILDGSFRKAMEDDPVTKPFMRYAR